MQATAIFLFAVCLQVSATTYSQTVSFTGKDIPLKTVFAAVKKQTGYGVFYASGEAKTLEGAANVTLDLKNVSLDLFMQVCLRNQPLEYSMEGTTIFIKKKELNATTVVDYSDSTLVSEIKGRVTNDKGEPLVNANIVLKRTGHGTVTDANGNFKLYNVTQDDILNVTFIGYQPQSIIVHDRKYFSLTMEAATNELDKVIVQAYGKTSQRLATSNIGVVRAEDIAKQPVMNVLQAVQGQVAGVVVTNTSGYASAPVKIEIRGRNTINPFAPSDPLYIIDGVPLTILDVSNTSSYSSGSSGILTNGFYSPANGQSPFFSINPLDVESIEILKDADATAIYGSRGANGVVLITTKKGKASKTRFDANVYTGQSEVPRHYPMLNTRQYVLMRTEALKNDGLSPNANNAPDLVIWDTTRYTDWQKYLWGGTGKTTDAQISLSGGDAWNTFRIGGGYRRETEILTVSGANKRGSFSFNLTHNSQNQRFNISLTGTYTYASVNTIYMPSAITLPPNAPSVLDSKGKLNYSGWSPLQGNYPFARLLQPYNSNTYLLNSSMLINYEIIPGLNLHTTVGYNNIQANQSTSTPIASQNPAYNPKGSAGFGYNYIHNIILEPQLEYNGFIAKGKLNILLGATLQSSKTDGVTTTGFGYSNDALLGTISNAPTKIAVDNYAVYKYAALFGRINYNWKNKYILNLNARRDGSSRFGPGRQYGNFGSLGAAYIFSEEEWIKKNVPFLSFGKIRGSYGITGSDQIGEYQYLTQWAYSTLVPYNNITPLIPQGHTDSLLHWEVNRKLELAMNLGILKDRITLEASYYRNRCNDQLVQFPTPLFSGFSNVTANSPANVENKGWEFSIASNILDSKSLRLTTKFNIGLNRNKLLSYPNLSQSPYAGLFTIGQSLNIRKLLHYTGVDPQTGLYTFQDKTKDGQITIDYSGKSVDDRFGYDLSPKFNGGFTTALSYKNWNVSLFFYFVKQIGLNALSPLSIPGAISNQPAEILNRWQKQGDIAAVARFTSNGYSNMSYSNFQFNSDGVYTDASYVRLQNISVAYSLPDKSVTKIGLKSSKLYIQAQNLFIITKYKGVDPEVQNFGGMPLPRVITAGISLNL